MISKKIKNITHVDKNNIELQSFSQFATTCYTIKFYIFNKKAVLFLFLFLFILFSINHTQR